MHLLEHVFILGLGVVVVLKAENTSLCLLEKKPGTRPSPHTTETRHYNRHWTPVHLDIHVKDLDAALARALEAGAEMEQVFQNPATDRQRSAATPSATASV